jgi:hypothetical protein
VPASETSKVFFLNPLSWTTYKKNNKKNNILFLMNENYLKKLEISVGSTGPKSIEAELNFQINTNNLIAEKLKSELTLSSGSSNINQKNISIESADIMNNPDKKQTLIYFIVKYESSYLESNVATQYFLMLMTIHNETNEINLNVIINFSHTLGENQNLINLSLISLNKFNEEMFILFSKPKNSSIFYLKFDNLNRGSCSQANYEMDSEIRGVNPICTFEDFSIDILTLDKGVMNFYYKNEKLNVLDKTKNFLNNFSTSQIEESEGDLNRSSLYGLNYNPYSKSDFKSNQNQNIQLILQNLLSDFYEKKLNGYYKELKQEVIDSEISASISPFTNFSNEKVIEEILKFLHSIVDDETTNVDNLNKESLKAELVIIEYLLKKQDNLDFVFNFLNFYKILENFDKNKIIFLKYLELKEKLILAIKLREIENNIIDKKLNTQPHAFQRDREVMYYNKSSEFFNILYQHLKRNYVSLSSSFSDRAFSKHLVYAKISQVEKILESIFTVYKSLIEDFTINKDDKMHYSYLIVNILNIIFGSIRNFQEKILLSQQSNNEQVGEDNILTYVLKNRKEFLSHPHYSWLLKESYLTYLNDIFYKVCQPNFTQDFLKNDLITYADNILYLIEFFYAINDPSKNNKVHFKLRKDIISNIIQFDPEKSLEICRKYNDYYNIVFICYNYKWIDILKEIMKSYYNTNSDSKVVFYFLKLYLLLESQSIRNPKEISEFTFFEKFEEYKEEIKKIIQDFPKLNFLYDVYIKSKDPLEISEDSGSLEKINMSIVDEKNISLFLKIQKIVNSLTRLNIEDLKIKNKISEEEYNKNSLLNEFIQKKINFSLLCENLITSLNMQNVDRRDVMSTIFNFVGELIKNGQVMKLNSFFKYKIAVQLTLLAREISVCNNPEKYEEIFNEIFDVKKFNFFKKYFS